MQTAGIGKELENIKKEHIPNFKTSQPALSKAKAELMAKLSEMHDKMKERGELLEYTTQEKEEISESLIKEFRERAEESKKDSYFQRWIKGG